MDAKKIVEALRNGNANADTQEDAADILEAALAECAAWRETHGYHGSMRLLLEPSMSGLPHTELGQRIVKAEAALDAAVGRGEGKR